MRFLGLEEVVEKIFNFFGFIVFSVTIVVDSFSHAFDNEEYEGKGAALVEAFSLKPHKNRVMSKDLIQSRQRAHLVMLWSSIILDVGSIWKFLRRSHKPRNSARRR